jgi:hypothetical protein
MTWRLDPRLAWLIIVLQAVALLVLLVAFARSGTPGGPSGLASRHPKLVVTFEDSATESAIRETLQAIEGNIVRGPSPEGAYTIEVRLALKSARDLDRIVEELRGRPQVVRRVEKAF